MTMQVHKMLPALILLVLHCGAYSVQHIQLLCEPHPKHRIYKILQGLWPAGSDAVMSA